MSAHGFRAQRGKGFETYSRDLLQPTGKRMSARALGLLVHLISRPDGWQTSGERLARDFREGVDAIESALRELETLGHLRRTKVRTTTGQIRWVWLYGEDPAVVAEQARYQVARFSGVLRRAGGDGADLLDGDQPYPGNPGLAEPCLENRRS